MANTFRDPGRVSLFQAEKALEENRRLLGQETHKIAHNMNEALLHLCQALQRMNDDMELLHRKLQPILKDMEEDRGIVPGMISNPRNLK